MFSASATGEKSAPLPSAADVLKRFQGVRNETDRLAQPLSPEDQVVQSMTDASPTKWHRAHTTWFFETFVLQPFLTDYSLFDEAYGYLFNSYYEAVGERHPRPDRGLLTRPSSDEIAAYRQHVDSAMGELLQSAADESWVDLSALILLGTHHEQQHQELLLMDILHAFSCNTLEPKYAGGVPLETTDMSRLAWMEVEGGAFSIGHEPEGGFAFDNEGPRHDVLVQPFLIANRLVTNGEWLAFMKDGGYKRPELWLADGWAVAQNSGWAAPGYWRDEGNSDWSQFSLRGRQSLNLDAPVCHISFYEADAFATWSGKRLPTEFEWEVASQRDSETGNLLSSGALRPLPASADKPLAQMFGDVWEHTRSAYSPYPRFKVADGAIGEYNGKFMSNQMVLRGGSCVTPGNHIRRTYRNFFYPHQRWMFAGLRLVEDIT